MIDVYLADRKQYKNKFYLFISPYNFFLAIFLHYLFSVTVCHFTLNLKYLMSTSCQYKDILAIYYLFSVTVCHFTLDLKYLMCIPCQYKEISIIYLLDKEQVYKDKVSLKLK